MPTPKKTSPGSFTILDCRELDTASAHRRLGRDARAHIHKILARRLDGAGSRENGGRLILRARACQSALKARLDLPGLDEAMRAAILQYQACLSAWARGAGLERYRHPNLAESCAGERVSAEDLATLLQEEETGCQTGVLREAGGGVILWHSEEDDEHSPGGRFDRFRLFFFRVANGRSACAFIYPDLLPGPTFGWQEDDFVQAVDSLHARPRAFEAAILPNTLAWLSLYLGPRPTHQSASLAESLGPFLGGYSLTAVSKKDGLVSVEKVEFINDRVQAGTLEAAAGCHLFQTNVISDLSLPAGAEEQTGAENRAFNEARLARTGRFLRVIREAAEPLPLIFRMLRSRLGGETAYANPSVKATLVCRIDPLKTSRWVNEIEIK